MVTLTGVAHERIGLCKVSPIGALRQGAVTTHIHEVYLPAHHVDSRKQAQQELAAGFAKWPTFRSRPGIIDSIAIHSVFVVLTKP